MTPETRGATRAKSRNVRDAMNARANHAPSFATGARWAPPGAWRPPGPENPPVFHRETLWFATAPPIAYIHFTSSKGSGHEHSEGTGKVPRSRHRASIGAPSLHQGAEPRLRCRSVGQRLRQHIRRCEAAPTIRGGSTTKTP